VPRKVEPEAALGAKKITVESGEIAIVGAQNFVVADAKGGLAAVGAVRANRRDVLHLPWARLVAIGSAGESADGADIDAHPAFFAFKVIVLVGDDDRLCASLAHAQGFDVHAFVTHADTAKAEYASRGVVID